MSKRFWLAFVSLSLLLLLAVLPSQAKVKNLKDSAVAIWLFEGDVKDMSGNNNHGTLEKGATFSDSGKVGKALSLDGKDDYVVVKTSASLDSTAKQATTMAWIKYNKPGKQRNQCCFDDQFVVGWAGWKNIMNVFGAGRNTNQGKVEIGSGQVAPNWSISPKTVNDNKWHHAVLTKSMYEEAIKEINS